MYCERERIGTTLEQLAGSPLDDPGVHILLVDDGSTDDTVTVAVAAAERLRLGLSVLACPVNRGKGAAVRTGMLAATAPAVVFVDADLSTGVDDVVRCFEAVEDGTADVVYADRSLAGSSIATSQPWHRVFIGRRFNGLLRRLALTDELDTQCGLKGFTAEAAATVFGRLATDGYAFDVEVLALARRHGLESRPLAVTWSHVEDSRVRPVADGFRMLLDALAIRRRLRRPASPSPGNQDTP